MSNDLISRRAFCANGGQALTLVSLASLGGVLQGCGGSSTSPSDAPELPTINSAIAGGAITMTIDASSPLNAVGGAALVQASGQSFLVSQTSAGSFTALTAICTHEQCTVTGFQSSQYVCPCHGSRYSISGAVVQGPASQSLRSFPTKFASPVLTITVA
ncbi:MAG TPA: Rieske (2Fe-2S) protein [Vicinamibacterales bacterium]|nr:Rieske (2Fe-2S) protein [Vicinamibacterales bacterium]